MKLPAVQSFPASCYSLSLTSIHPPQHFNFYSLLFPQCGTSHEMSQRNVIGTHYELRSPLFILSHSAVSIPVFLCINLSLLYGYLFIFLDLFALQLQF